MNIVILNGSPRKNGSTAYILRQMEKILLTQGAQVFHYDLISQNMALCSGCCVCYKRGSCIINDDAEKISAQIEAADGIVIGSPTMTSNVSGVLNVFIDRGHFVVEQLLHKKYAVCVTTYENYGGHESLKIMKNLVTRSGAELTGAFSEKIPFNSNLTNNAGINNKAKTLALKLFSDIERKKVYVFQRLKQKLVRNIGIKPFILRKGKNYEAVQKRWSRLGLLPQE